MVCVLCVATAGAAALWHVGGGAAVDGWREQWWRQSSDRTVAAAGTRGAGSCSQSGRASQVSSCSYHSWGPDVPEPSELIIKFYLIWEMKFIRLKRTQCFYNLYFTFQVNYFSNTAMKTFQVKYIKYSN